MDDTAVDGTAVDGRAVDGTAVDGGRYGGTLKKVDVTADQKTLMVATAEPDIVLNNK